MSPSRKQRGPNRKFTRLEGKAIGESMIAGKYLNQSQAAADLNCSRATISREIGEQRKEEGLKPVTKKSQKRRTDQNQPRIYDMQ